jgi:hypothetical protein
MGCLDNLFNVNLDFAIQVPDLTKLFQGAVSDAEQQICTYAQDAWNKVTEPLQANLQLPSFGKLELPGGGGGGDVPSLDFNYDDGGSLNMAAPADPNTGRRSNDGTLLNDLYNSLYGPGGN